MRRSICLLLSVVLAVSFLLCSCGKKEKAETYLELAQEYLDQGKQDLAYDVLKKGYAATADDRLAVMMADLMMNEPAAATTPTTATPTEPPTEAQTQPPTEAAATGSSFEGTWAEADISWDYGGLIIDIAQQGGTLDITATYTQSAPASRVAEFSIQVDEEDIVDDTITTEFLDESWGISGDIRLTLSSDSLTCDIENTEYVGTDPFPVWGISDGTYALVRNENAHEAMVGSSEEYEDLFPENNSTQPVLPTRQCTSTILSSLGMTLDEFRSSCSPLQYTEKRAYTSHLGYLISPDHMLDYPLEFMDMHASFLFFDIDRKFVDSQGVPCYTMVKSYGGMRLYDMRDNVYSPTFSQGDTISGYVIFKGLEFDNIGGEYLTFLLLDGWWTTPFGQ